MLSIRSTENIESIIIMRVAKISMGVREKLNLLLKMTKTAMASSMSRKKRNAEVTAEVDVAVLEVVVEASTEEMTKESIAEVATDLEVNMAKRDTINLKVLPSKPLQLLLRRKKKLKLQSLLRNSLVGVKQASSDDKLLFLIKHNLPSNNTLKYFNFDM